MPLQDLPLRLLHELVQRPGELVTREELREALWPADVHVDFDGSLNAAMRRVREALGDSARDARFVETVPKRGYRFLAPVTVESAEASEKEGTGKGTDAIDPPHLPTPTSPAHAPSRAGTGGRGRLWPTFVVALALIVWILTARFAPRSVPDEPKRLAILPLEVIGEDERLAPIAAGLTDELIVHVGSLAPEHLVVVAPSSVRRAQADGGDFSAMAERLDARYVLAGTLRLEGDRLRVAARLVQAQTESLLWTTGLEGRLGSLLDVERELAGRLGEGLREKLLDGTRLATDDATEVAASAAAGAEYEHFLRARHFLALQTPESFRSAERELLTAVELVPDFADAWAALATTRALIGIYDLERPRDVFPRAEVALGRALALEPDNVDALVAKAVIDGTFHWRFGVAEKSLRRALELAPQHVEARRWYALLLQSRGRSVEAQAELEAARRLDPLSLTLLSTIGWCHFLARDFEAAIEAAKGVLELDADYMVAWDDLKWFYTVAGQDEQAAEAFFKVVELEGDGHAVPRLRQLYAEQGFEGLLEESLNNLRSASEDGYHSPYDIAIAAAALGQVELALDWLEKSAEEREVDLLSISRDPRLDALRSEPRFAALLEQFPAP